MKLSLHIFLFTIEINLVQMEMVPNEPNCCDQNNIRAINPEELKMNPRNRISVGSVLDQCWIIYIFHTFIEHFVNFSYAGIQ
jgi:hypothetical protein